MAYSTAANQVILFGGQIFADFDYTDMTWTFDFNIPPGAM